MNAAAAFTCVLFLDFDGVTHPEGCSAEIAFCCLPFIEEVLREHVEVSIVISSAWRDFYTLDQLRAFFSADIAGRVIGVTNSIKNPSNSWLAGFVPEFDREWECTSWLAENCEVPPRWVAIDDRAYWFRPDCPDLLLIDCSLGFRLSDQDALRQMFRQRL